MSDTRELRLEFEELFIEEAWKLDHDELEAWLEYFSPEVRYWAPIRENVSRGDEDFERPHLLAHFDETRDTLALRVARLRTGNAHAEEPPSRVRHFVSNVRILAREGNRVQVASNVLVFRSREGRQEHLFVATRRDWWRQTETGWQNDERLIIFDHDVMENITVFF